MASRIAFLMRTILHDNYNGSGLRAIQSFFDLPRFSRRWIIQEACLANRATVHCGEYPIPLPVVNLAAARFQSLDMSSYTKWRRTWADRLLG